MSASMALRLRLPQTSSARQRSATASRQEVDHQLLNQIRRRKVHALTILYDRYASRALGLAFRIVKDRDLAEQIVQDAFWRVWCNADRYQASRGSFGTWLFAIVHNLAIDQLRRRHNEVPLGDAVHGETFESEADASNVSELALRHLRSEEIRAALNSLPEPQRRVIELAYFEGLSRPEIAQQLSAPLGTVHTRARLGIQKLRQSLKPDGD
jgi:RNA polymerase sigma-70 factor, ECF subfamily